MLISDIDDLAKAMESNAIVSDYPEIIINNPDKTHDTIESLENF